MNNISAFLQNAIWDNLVYVLICIVVLLGLFKCILPVLHNAGLLMRGVKRLEKNIGKGERPIWQEPQFLGRALQLHWQKFLLNAQHLDMRGIPCNTSDYINEESVIYTPGHAQFGDMIPTLLTSLGILGTFVGLARGLGNLSIDTAEATIQSIPTLLSGMKYAFTTSIVGITCSLGFNMVNRIVIGHAFKAIDAFDEAFYELAMPRPLDPTVQLICQNQDSTAIIKNTADSLKNSFIHGIEHVMVKTLNPVAQSMDQFITATTSQQIEGVERIIDRFVAGMNASLNNQFITLGETLTRVNKTNVLSYDSVQKNVEAVSKITEDVQALHKASGEIVQLIAEYISREQSALGASDESFKHQLMETLLSMQKGMEQQSEFTRNLKEYRDLLQKDYGNYIKKGEELAHTIHKEGVNQKEVVQALAEQTRKSMQSIVESYKASAEKIAKQLNQNMEILNTQFGELSALLANNRGDAHEE